MDLAGHRDSLQSQWHHSMNRHHPNQRFPSPSLKHERCKSTLNYCLPISTHITLPSDLEGAAKTIHGVESPRIAYRQRKKKKPPPVCQGRHLVIWTMLPVGCGGLNHFAHGRNDFVLGPTYFNFLQTISSTSITHPLVARLKWCINGSSKFRTRETGSSFSRITSQEPRV